MLTKEEREFVTQMEITNARNCRLYSEFFKIIDRLSARCEELEEGQKKLHALERAGVDNWEGYDDAMESIWEKDE